MKRNLIAEPQGCRGAQRRHESRNDEDQEVVHAPGSLGRCLCVKSGTPGRQLVAAS